jgi:hypothetical protein
MLPREKTSANQQFQLNIFFRKIRRRLLFYGQSQMLFQYPPDVLLAFFGFGGKKNYFPFHRQLQSFFDRTLMDQRLVAG